MSGKDDNFYINWVEHSLNDEKYGYADTYIKDNYESYDKYFKRVFIAPKKVYKLFGTDAIEKAIKTEIPELRYKNDFKGTEKATLVKKHNYLLREFTKQAVNYNNLQMLDKKHYEVRRLTARSK
jgi:hypothetical protein